MLYCRIQSSKPTVIAEMAFAERSSAENVVATFNNQMVCSSGSSNGDIYLGLFRRTVDCYTYILKREPILFPKMLLLRLL
jgi:hypothetical protein